MRSLVFPALFYPAVIVLACGAATRAGAQASPGTTSVSAAVTGIHQFTGDFDRGGDVEWSSLAFSAGVTRQFSEATSGGVTGRYGTESWSFGSPVAFGGQAPWTELDRVSLGLSLGQALSRTLVLVVSPSVEWAYAPNAKMEDALIYGAVLSAAKVIAPGRVMGLGVSAYRQFYSVKISPFVIVNWKLTDRLKIANALPAGPEGGAGVELATRWRRIWSSPPGAFAGPMSGGVRLSQHGGLDHGLVEAVGQAHEVDPRGESLPQPQLVPPGAERADLLRCHLAPHDAHPPLTCIMHAGDACASSIPPATDEEANPMRVSVPHILLVAALLMAARHASAQSDGETPIAQGRHWIGLTMGASSEHQENTTSVLQDVSRGQNSSWQIALDYGWFLHDGTSVGIGLEYHREESDVTSDQALGPDRRVDRGVSTAGVALHSRSYLPLGNPHFYLYNQTGISAGFTWGTEVTTLTESVESDISGQRYALDLQPGIAVLIARGFAVQASVNVLGLSYQSERTKTPGQPDAVKTATALDFELDLLKLGIGLTYYF